MFLTVHFTSDVQTMSADETWVLWVLFSFKRLNKCMTLIDNAVHSFCPFFGNDFYESRTANFENGTLYLSIVNLCDWKIVLAFFLECNEKTVWDNETLDIPKNSRLQWTCFTPRWIGIEGSFLVAPPKMNIFHTNRNSSTNALSRWIWI